MKKLVIILSLLISSNCFGQDVIASSGKSVVKSDIALDWTIGEVFIYQTVGDSLQLDRGFLQLFKEELNTLISENTIDAEVRLYPNPSSDFIFIEIEGSNRYLYSVQNITGKRLSTGYIKDQGMIDINHIPEGTYILELSNESKEYGIYTFVKMR